MFDLLNSCPIRYDPIDLCSGWKGEETKDGVYICPSLYLRGLTSSFHDLLLLDYEF